MSHTVACSHFNSDCPASFTTTEQDELLAHVEMHTRTAHPQMEWTPELAEVVKSKATSAS